MMHKTLAGMCCSSVWAVLLEAMLACSVAGSKRTPDLAPNPPPPKAEAAQALDVPERPLAASSSRDAALDATTARAWIDSLRERDVDAMVRRTGFPFELRDDGMEGKCARTTTARSASVLPDAVGCLLADDALIQVLKNHEVGGVEALPGANLQPWARQWRTELRPEWSLFTAYYEGGEAWFALNLQVGREGVRSLWKTGLSAHTQLQVARRWLEAFRERDAQQMANVTAFPFEIREAGREVSCGSRTLKDSGELADGIACLLSSRRLNQAIKQSGDAPLQAAHSSDEIPDWARAWRKESEDIQRLPISVLYSTMAGYQFDIVLMVGATGVHSLWKLGSFESNN